MLEFTKLKKCLRASRFKRSSEVLKLLYFSNVCSPVLLGSFLYELFIYLFIDLPLKLRLLTQAAHYVHCKYINGEDFNLKVSKNRETVLVKLYYSVHHPSNHPVFPEMKN